jgi:hypothetical protein
MLINLITNITSMCYVSPSHIGGNLAVLLTLAFNSTSDSLLIVVQVWLQG